LLIFESFSYTQKTLLLTITQTVITFILELLNLDKKPLLPILPYVSTKGWVLGVMVTLLLSKYIYGCITSIGLISSSNFFSKFFIKFLTSGDKLEYIFLFFKAEISDLSIL